MSEEELKLRDEIADIIDSHRFDITISYARIEDMANDIIARTKKAGWKSPEDWKEKWDASEHYK